MAGEPVFPECCLKFLAKISMEIISKEIRKLLVISAQTKPSDSFQID